MPPEMVEGTDAPGPEAKRHVEFVQHLLQLLVASRQEVAHAHAHADKAVRIVGLVPVEAEARRVEARLPQP
eukprot:9325733-Lingulodinium_polyedra.AAC.1